MYTKTEILQIAQAQLALDFNCQPADFAKEKNTVVENQRNDGRRLYDSDGCFFKVLCFGGKAVISTAAAFLPWCEENLRSKSAAWLFEYPQLRVIDQKLQEFGHEIEDIHQYFLPNPHSARKAPLASLRWFEGEAIRQFEHDDRFSEAFVFDKNRPDVLAVAACDGENIMGMAGASADSRSMWQVGIDVLPAYRSQGIGTKLVEVLTDEILKRGKVPFYGTVTSHFHSLNIAINAGYFPVWAELYSASKAVPAG